MAEMEDAVQRTPRAPGRAAEASRIIVDAHVHLHECYPPQRFFDAAWSNFAEVARSLGSPSAFTGVLMLTESADDDRFAALAEDAARADADSGAEGQWRPQATAEACSLTVRRGDDRLVLIAGHQVAAEEDLEILFLGTTRKVPDGQPIRRLLDDDDTPDAVRVLPWGPGKWLFSRGRLVGEILRSMRGKEFFLGDEGGRPVFWPTPTRFADAERGGTRILRGTDPLPFPWEVDRVATFGFTVRADLDPSRPWAGLRPILSDPAVDLRPYGRLERTVRFFRNQIGMQMRKRRRLR